MSVCPHPDCDWRPIAPSSSGRLEKVVTHLVEEHAREVDGDVPDGGFEVRRDGGDWEFVPRSGAEAVDHDEF